MESLSCMIFETLTRTGAQTISMVRYYKAGDNRNGWDKICESSKKGKLYYLKELVLREFTSDSERDECLYSTKIDYLSQVVMR